MIHADDQDRLRIGRGDPVEEETAEHPALPAPPSLTVADAWQPRPRRWLVIRREDRELATLAVDDWNALIDRAGELMPGRKYLITDQNQKPVGTITVLADGRPMIILPAVEPVRPIGR